MPDRKPSLMVGEGPSEARLQHIDLGSWEKRGIQTTLKLKL